ncbi:hcrt [Pungitius sinensis]
MTLFPTSQKMPWFPIDFHKASGMDTSNRKVLALALMLLLSQVACDAHSLSQCCRQPARSCRLSVFLCRSGSKNFGGALPRDDAAGILTLGKRNDDEHNLQSRLNQLLQGSRNQAAGILTMGKRIAERVGEQYMAWLAQSGSTITTPLPDIS